jgi:tripartite-type tricarboxylate transporter receptor subunit TctC
LKDPEFAKQVFDAGAFPIGNSPEEFAAQIEKEIKKWEAVAKFAKVTADS